MERKLHVLFRPGCQVYLEAVSTTGKKIKILSTLTSELKINFTFSPQEEVEEFRVASIEGLAVIPDENLKKESQPQHFIV